MPETDSIGNLWEKRRMSRIDPDFHPVRNPPEFRDLYGKYYDPEVWVIVGKVHDQTVR
jgi:hypothetical protein